MSYKYMTIDDKNKIGVLRKEGYSARKIATVLGYHHSSISKDLKKRKKMKIQYWYIYF